MNMDLPLSKHSMNNRLELDKDQMVMRRSNPSSPDLIQLSDSDCTAAKTGNGYQIMISEDVEDFPADGHSSGCLSNGTSRSPSVSSPASESPTPTNSTHEKSWTQRHQPQWQSLVNDEHRQLLGTEDDSSDRHSSDEDPTEEDIWAMTTEQEEYYLQQFISIQPDATALLPGNRAKEFFEKSKLPVGELSKIWQLADVTEDGALSLEEFYAAMHLVVLRKNHIEIPNILPQSLYPKSFMNQFVSNNHRPSIAKVSNLNRNFSLDSNSVSDDHRSLQSIRSIDKQESLTEEHITSPTKSKEWAKFSESPTNALASPGPKPCNFDFLKAAVEKDPKILHPKPLRLTPESNLQERMESTTVSSSQSKDPRYYHVNSSFNDGSLLKSGAELGDSSTSFTVCGAESISPVPSDDCKDVMDKSSHGPSSLSVTLGHPQSKMELPPPPPPRSYRNHVRSSSLDLNKAQKLPVGPPVPPRISPNMGSPQRVVSAHHDDEAVSNRLSDVCEDSAVNLPNASEERSRHSAFEVYRKPHSIDEPSPNAGKFTLPDEINQHSNNNYRVQDKREVLSSLRALKEKNIVLSKVNSELNQELAEVIEDRIALQYQLEQMKPFSQ